MLTINIWNGSIYLANYIYLKVHIQVRIHSSLGQSKCSLICGKSNSSMTIFELLFQVFFKFTLRPYSGLSSIIFLFRKFKLYQCLYLDFIKKNKMILIHLILPEKLSESSCRYFQDANLIPLLNFSLYSFSV